jgi:hypothetical protein
LVYWALHAVFPDKRLDAWVRESPSAKVLQQEYQERWDMIDAPHLEEIAAGHHHHQTKEPKTTTSQVLF